LLVMVNPQRFRGLRSPKLQNVAARKGRPLPDWVFRIIILPPTLFGVFLVTRAFCTIAVAMFGIPATGVVTRVERQGRSYTLQYAWDAEGKRMQDSASISREQFEQYQAALSPASPEPASAPQTIQLRYLRSAGLSSPEMELTAENVALLLFIAVFWSSCVSVAFYALWIAPLKEFVNGRRARRADLGPSSELKKA